jgi:hypothetical protein
MSETSAKEVNAMKRVLLALALIGLGAGIACAQPTNLAGGVFITHYPPGIVYTIDPTDWCATYGQFAISSCDQQNNTIDTELGAVWYVLAAFNENDKVWCGTEFGLGAYNPGAVAFVGNGQCPTDALVIPAGAWPGPSTGIAVAATGTPWTGNFQPVFWFACYAYTPTLIQLTNNPATGFGGFANCMTPPTPYTAACFGAMGILQPGIACCPVPPAQHACCIGDACVLVFSTDECLGLGGVDHPDWASCEGNPCFIPPVPGVCCVGEICYFVTQEECDAMGGVMHPEFTECTDTTCHVIIPVDPTSWGAIKAIYR